MRSSVTLQLVATCLLAALLASKAPAASQRQATPDHYDAGVQALEQRRYSDAAVAFAAAVQARPRDAEAWHGAGVAAYVLGRSAEAERFLRQALALRPAFIEASTLLGELQYRSGRLGDAIATYEAALALAPGNTTLAAAVRAWSAEQRAESRYGESRGAHFRVLFEGPEDQALARRVVEMLETAYARIGSVLRSYPEQPIQVVLYTQQQFRDVTRSPGWAGAAYDGRIRVPVKGVDRQVDQLETILTHEYVHAIVEQLAGRNVPAWLNEGLATVFEPDGVELATRTLDHERTRVPVSELHRSFAGLPAARARVAYAESALAVKRLLDSAGTSAMVLFLRELATGTPFEAAFHRRLGMTYEEFQRLVAP